MCTECHSKLCKRTPELAPAALTNGMMIYYAPTELYELNATVMKVLCVSVCITSMICFTFENKYRSNRSFDEHAHANQYRMAARGNATSFPLPWHYLLQQLQAGDDQADPSNLVALPRTGYDLANVVSVLLNKSADAIESDTDLARLVHQAMIRRDVVVKLIASMERRGHRAYRHVVMDDVERRVQVLPEDGVPLEILKLLSLDQLLEQLHIQKSATPVSTPQSVQEAAAHLDVL